MKLSSGKYRISYDLLMPSLYKDATFGYLAILLTLELIEHLSKANM